MGKRNAVAVAATVTQPTAPLPPAKPMTKGEREDLRRLIKDREKVLKSAAEQRRRQPLGVE